IFMGPPPCVDFTGPVGTKSGFELETAGVDVNNTSRFDGMGLSHTVTYGADYFDDTVKSGGDSYGTDLPDEGHVLTPSGERQVGGAFLQWMVERGNWLDVIGAVRYDTYQMEGGG